VLYVGITEEQIFFSIVGAFGFIFFSLGLIVQVGRTISRKPLFTIKWNGIEDTGSIGAMGFIPFEEIKAIVLGNILGRKSIGIVFYDLDRYMLKLSPMRQRIVRTNISSHYPAVLLRVDSLKGKDANEVYDLLSNVLEQYRNQTANLN
jgi:hypothetical protein